MKAERKKSIDLRSDVGHGGESVGDASSSLIVSGEGACDHPINVLGRGLDHRQEPLHRSREALQVVARARGALALHRRRHALQDQPLRVRGEALHLDLKQKK